MADKKAAWELLEISFHDATPGMATVLVRSDLLSDGRARSIEIQLPEQILQHLDLPVREALAAMLDRERSDVLAYAENLAERAQRMRSAVASTTTTSAE